MQGNDATPPPTRPAPPDVEIWDPAAVSGKGWRELRDARRGKVFSKPEVGTMEFPDFLDEVHHRIYGRPWCIGRSYFDQLVRLGLQPGHRVLDFGCGAGRLGIWLIAYLERSGYTGIDHHRDALAAFAQYEIPLHGLAAKSPRLVLDGSLDVDRLGASFDLILDCYVSFHLGQADRQRLYAGFARALRPGGRIILPHAPTLGDDALAPLGLAVASDEVVTLDFLAGHVPPSQATDHWHVIARR